jgi:hypothetical protein
MIKNNKKGWVRIAEAFIAITLMFSVFLALYAKQSTQPDVSDEVYSLESSILKQIANDEGLRQNVLSKDEDALTTFINNNNLVPPSLNYSIIICNLDEVCSMNVYQKEVFASETVISSTLLKYSPKVVKIFIWRK